MTPCTREQGLVEFPVDGEIDARARIPQRTQKTQIAKVKELSATFYDLCVFVLGGGLKYASDPLPMTGPWSPATKF